MGAFLNKPKTDKTNDDGVGSDFRYVVAAMQGWRADMEDAHQVKVSITDSEPFKSWSFFAVFDGHAGYRVALLSAENLLQYLLDTAEFKELVEEMKATNGVVSEKAKDLITRGMKTGFLKLDEHIANQKGPDGEEREKSGTTAICAILSPEYVFFGNLGDSRGLLSRKNEEVFFTLDHKPYLEGERDRIVKAGGTVMIQRVNGSLAVSRALGDFDYKNVPGLCPTEQLVSPEPDVYIVKRNKSEDQFIVLACDGIYDVLENEELCVLLRSRFTVTEDLRSATNQVLDYCLSRGSRDNMTMIVVVLDAAPKADPQAAVAESEWLERVRQKTTELAEKHGEGLRDLETSLLVSQLKNETNLDESPLFGGLDLARHIIDQVVDEYRKAHNIHTDSADSNSSSPDHRAETNFS